MRPPRLASAAAIHLLQKGEDPLIYGLLALLSITLLLATLALLREHRLRRGLQAILNRLLTRWRFNEVRPNDGHRDRRDSGPDDSRL